MGALDGRIHWLTPAQTQNLRTSRAVYQSVQAEVADRTDGLHLDDVQQIFEVEVARFHYCASRSSKPR